MVIKLTVTAYFLSMLFYCFYDTAGTFWYNYFWIVTLLICIAGFGFNFIERKSEFDKSLILLVMFLRIFTLLYYIIGLILHKQVWMSTHVFFIIAMGVSSFIGIIFLRFKAWKRNRI